eukprot:664392-Rhodomonas_salina.3
METDPAGTASNEDDDNTRSPSSLLFLEVLGIHGSRHRLSIDIQSKSIDVRTGIRVCDRYAMAGADVKLGAPELIDKLGYPPSPSRPDSGTRAMVQPTSLPPAPLRCEH